MEFADLKNDYIFKRIFATHPHLLCGLLNDLLERSEDDLIVSLEYLPSEQLPLIEGAKLSILDVRCKSKSGTMFIVEMQLIHHPGFINRVVYNACKAYSGQLKARDAYTKLTDVVAISICDFELWPDAEQIAKNLPLVPMLSRWQMTERSSKNNALLQVQYAFLELPKVPEERPRDPGPDLWAWLFVHAPDLTEVPADLASGPYREALELANQATLTRLQLDAYLKVCDEIQQVTEIADARLAEGLAKGLAKGRALGKVEGIAEGRAEGKAEGKAEGLANILLVLLKARGFSLSADIEARILGTKDASTLEHWILRLSTAAIAPTAASIDELLG